MLRRLVAFGALTTVLLTGLIISSAPSAWACSCATNKPAVIAFAGRVQSASGDSFTFVDVVSESGGQLGDRVVVEILAGRATDASGGRQTSCDIAAAQPLVGGVYLVTASAQTLSVNSCVGSFSLVEAPAPGDAAPTDAAETQDVASNSRRPAVAIVLGVVLLAVAAGMAIHGRRQRTD